MTVIEYLIVIASAQTVATGVGYVLWKLRLLAPPSRTQRHPSR